MEEKMYNGYRIFDLYTHQQNNYPQEKAYNAKIDKQWESFSIDQVLEKANKIALGLLEKLALQKGDRVAIISNSRLEWHLLDLAFLQLGVVVIPVYPTNTVEDYKYILNDSACKYVFVGDRSILRKVKLVQSDIPSLIEIYSFDALEGAVNWKILFEHITAPNFTKIKAISDTIAQEDLATIVYTSGTTSKSKGVMLTHLNIVSNVIDTLPSVDIRTGDKILTFLPLCHIFERTICYVFVYIGIHIYYAESIDTLSANLLEVKPNLFTTVPRLLEKIYEKIVDKGNKLTGFKKKLFFWALDLGTRWEPFGANGWWYETKLAIANILVFSKWRAALGGELRFIVSGSSALQMRLAKVFTAAKIPILEGYGLTETSPVIAVNQLSKKDTYKLGTVGIPIQHLQIKIAEDGEILAKGPTIMKGYYNLPEATKEAIDADAWFHTGDVGQLIDGKFLKITDRKKEIFKTSGGKYILPQLMENKFKESPFIEQIMIIGENEKFPSAFVQPSWEKLQDFCQQNQMVFGDYQQMLSDSTIISLLKGEIEKNNQSFAQYEQIKKYEFVPDVWSIDTDELTPTLKLKRRNILAKYDNLYKKIYPKTMKED